MDIKLKTKDETDQKIDVPWWGCVFVIFLIGFGFGFGLVLGSAIGHAVFG